MQTVGSDSCRTWRQCPQPWAFLGCTTAAGSSSTKYLQHYGQVRHTTSTPAALAVRKACTTRFAGISWCSSHFPNLSACSARKNTSSNGDPCSNVVAIMVMHIPSLSGPSGPTSATSAAKLPKGRLNQTPDLAAPTSTYTVAEPSGSAREPVQRIWPLPLCDNTSCPTRNCGSSDSITAMLSTVSASLS